MICKSFYIAVVDCRIHSNYIEKLFIKKISLVQLVFMKVGKFRDLRIVPNFEPKTSLMQSWLPMMVLQKRERGHWLNVKIYLFWITHPTEVCISATYYKLVIIKWHDWMKLKRKFTERWMMELMNMDWHLCKNWKEKK